MQTNQQHLKEETQNTNSHKTKRRHIYSGLYYTSARVLLILVNELGEKGKKCEVCRALQWATLATHHFLRAYIFSQKCWNRTFSMIIYLLTIYLFDDIEKNIRITHVNNFATPKAILTKVHDCTCNLNVYIFYLHFVLGNIYGDRCDRKHPKQLLYSSKSPFFGRWNQWHWYCLKKCSFWRHINVSYNKVAFY